MNSFPQIPRRIVTGNKQGRSVIVEDGHAANISEHIPGLIISDIWATDSTPATLNREAVVPNEAFPLTPSQGTYFRYVNIPPDKDLSPGLQSSTERHPMFHQTDTLDYIIIASGEVYLLLDEAEVKLKAGDIVIQNGTSHAWSNRSDKPCVQLAVLIGARNADPTDIP